MGRLHDAAVAAIVGAIVGATRRTSVYKRQLSARLSAQLKAVAPIDRADSCMSVYVQNTLDKPDQTLSVGDPALRQSLCDRICTQLNSTQLNRELRTQVSDTSKSAS